MANYLGAGIYNRPDWERSLIEKWALECSSGKMITLPSASHVIFVEAQVRPCRLPQSVYKICLDFAV